MVKVGQSFKMEPLTRKAKNAQLRTCKWLGIAEDELEWTRVDPNAEDRGLVMLVKPVGDNGWEQLRWVYQKNDPDWKIV